MNNTVKTVLAAVVGITVGLVIGLTVTHYFVDPYIASKAKSAEPVLSSQEIADNFRRAQIVADGMAEYDDHLRKVACDAYIAGLKDQKLPISSVIAEACKL